MDQVEDIPEIFLPNFSLVGRVLGYHLSLGQINDKILEKQLASLNSYLSNEGSA